MKFYKFCQLLANSIILVEDWIMWKRFFETFSTGHCAGDIENKDMAGKYIKKILISMSPVLH